MTTKFDKITVVDLECTCEENKFEYAKTDIIEIGVALLDAFSGKVTKSNSIYVKTDEIISEYCTKLTGITQNMLKKQGKTFQEAIEQLKNHYPTAKTWVSWGGFDERVLKEQCERYKIEYPFRNACHLDAGYIYGLMYRCKEKPNLEDAVKNLGMEFEGKQHCGKDDAVNTAKVLARLLWEPKYILGRGKQETIPVSVTGEMMCNYPDKRLEGWNMFRIEYGGVHQDCVYEKRILVPSGVCASEIKELFKYWQRR
jgi:inhibitor of KinA sporulation pathway (predicted exonuclease)